GSSQWLTGNRKPPGGICVGTSATAKLARKADGRAETGRPVALCSPSTSTTGRIWAEPPGSRSEGAQGSTGARTACRQRPLHEDVARPASSGTWISSIRSLHKQPPEHHPRQSARHPKAELRESSGEGTDW